MSTSIEKPKSAWHSWLVKMYTRKMLRFKKIAEYNLYRHDEAVNMYQKKKDYRAITRNDNGHYIAPEGADMYLSGYNYNWELYMKYKNKLDAINAFYQE